MKDNLRAMRKRLLALRERQEKQRAALNRTGSAINNLGFRVAEIVAFTKFGLKKGAVIEWSEKTWRGAPRTHRMRVDSIHESYGGDINIGGVTVTKTGLIGQRRHHIFRFDPTRHRIIKDATPRR